MIPTGISRDELSRSGRKLFRRDGKQILLIALGARVFAIANRCPHEGYPLSEGTLGPDCVLTCNWHNWKFDLASGAEWGGRDPVRTYPTEVRDGEIFVDPADPPREQQREAALRGLEAALAENDRPRIAREVARLDRAGFDGREAVVHAIRIRNPHFEEGMTHAYAAAADWLALAERTDRPDERLAAIVEPLGHIAWDSEGADVFSYSRERAPWDARAFVAALEAEDENAAVARLRGALAEGLTFRELSPAFAEAALAHYADFGHCAIYTLKAGQLIGRLGNDSEEPVLLSLVRMIARATREERLPEFRGYARAIAEWGGGHEPARIAPFVGSSISQALARTLASSGRPPRETYDALLGAAAYSLLRFDLAVDCATENGIADNVGWLDFTHALTFANACRHICEERPDLWPKALLQLALFVGRNRKYVGTGEAVECWRVADRALFLAREQRRLFDHGIPEPIIACHRLKVLFALEDELREAPDAPWADEMCAGVNRYLHTPMKRHHGLRNAAQALEFVKNEA